MTLPAYSFVLGLIALLGLMAIAAGVKVNTPQDAVPADSPEALRVAAVLRLSSLPHAVDPAVTRTVAASTVAIRPTPLRVTWLAFSAHCRHLPGPGFLRTVSSGSLPGHREIIFGHPPNTRLSGEHRVNSTLRSAGRSISCRSGPARTPCRRCKW